jgi:hypothetical protein
MANRVFFANEVNTDLIDFDEKNGYQNGDWSRPILYEGFELVVQLNDAKILFGILNYKNPQNPVREKVSTGICMEKKEAQPFLHLVNELEKLVDQCFGGNGCEFISSVKRSRRGERHLRVKMPVGFGRAQFDVFHNAAKKQAMSVAELKEEFYHGREVNIMLALNPVWCSGFKFGVSWRLEAVEMTAPVFREGRPKKASIKRSLIRSQRRRPSVEQEENGEDGKPADTSDAKQEA